MPPDIAASRAIVSATADSHASMVPTKGSKESNRKERKQGKCWPYARRQLMPRKMPEIVALVGPKSRRKENGNTKQDESAGKNWKKWRKQNGSTPAENQYTLKHG